MWRHISTVYKISPISSLHALQEKGNRERQTERDSDWQAGRPITPTLTSHQPPWAQHHAIFILSQSASEPARQSKRQDSPQRCSSFFSSQSAPQPHHLVSALTGRSMSVKLCSDDQNLIWGASSPTLPLTQRANAPLKMHILPAHLVYLMHMHHTSGTKRNYIASDTEYPSSHIQFRFLQEAGGVFFPCAAKQTEP